MKSRLRTLVNKGIVTKTQADQHLRAMQELFENVEIGRGFHGSPGRGGIMDGG
jgi:hypothetical protein